MRKRLLLRATLLGLPALALAGSGFAQDFPPKKTVTLVVGFAPGGAADAAARLIAKKLGDNIGQTVVVDNKAGAGGNIAHQLVANGPADGSMLLLGSIGPLTIAPHMMKVPYDPFKDLAPVSGGVHFPNVLVVNAGSGIKTLADFVAAARKQPGAVTYASTGSGSASHLTGELFALQIKAEMVHVPYRGGAPMTTDLISGVVPVGIDVITAFVPYFKAGQIVPLAVTSANRSALAPDVPSVVETGHRKLILDNFFGLSGPAKMPPDVVARLNTAVNEILAGAEIKKKMADLGIAVSPVSQPAFAGFVKEQVGQLGPTVKGAGVKL